MAVILGVQFHDIARLLKGEFERQVRETRLTLLQWRTLGALSRKTGQTQRSLADRLEVSPMTMSGIVERLEAMGYVSRDTDPADKRAKRVSITEDGQAMARTMRPVAEAVYARALSGLTEADQAVLVSLLRRIVDNLSTPPPNEESAFASDNDGSKQGIAT